TATSYPESGDAPCGQAPYTGEFKSIKAIDAKTVEFDLCASDVAFLSKIAFSSFQINDTAFLQSTVADGTIVEKSNGAGPYVLKDWVRGDHITLEANPNYWGDAPKVKTVIFRWSTESSQRLLELQSGNVDGIDNVGPDDFATIQGDSSLKLYPREALNVFYVGFNNTFKPFDNEKVRQAIAMGIDRQRIVDNFYPAGSQVASHFTPCAIPGGCEGPEWYGFDKAAAKKLLADAGFPSGFKTVIHYRDVVRGYLPDPNVVAQDIQAQLKANLNIDATIDVQESGTFIDNANAGKLDGIHLLGWGADYPDVTNFLDFHFGSGASPQFGKHWDDIVADLKDGATKVDQSARNAAYAKANEAVRTHVPMIPIAHGGSAVAFKADVEGAHSSPLGNESMAVMSPDGRDQLVWMQNGEPAGLYCADETDGESLRVCEQFGASLYGYKIAGTEAEPSLAEKCEPNADLTVWTCTLRDAKFADGSTLDANDVVLTYAVQWDTKHPLHKARIGDFTYFSSLFGGFLNPPAS
ncbi:MAG TPA: ABC transporter substrate-binding protein, partial [Candidatus Limnocylindrales bacterium]